MSDMFDLMIRINMEVCKKGSAIMKRVVSMAAILSFVISASNPLLSAVAEASDHVFRIAALPPKGGTYMNAMDAFSAEIKEKSGGAVSFRFYPGGSMGDEKDYIKRMRINLDGAVFSAMGLGDIIPQVRVLEAPFIFESYEEAAYVRDHVASSLEKLFEAKGYTVLGWVEQGRVYIWSTNTPVAGIDELKKHKCWVWAGCPLAASVYEAVGVTPIALSPIDVITSLQTGIIDTIYCAANILIQLEWYSRIKYMTDFPLLYAIGATIVKKSKFDGMPPELQEMTKEAFKRHMDDLIRNTRAENTDALEILKNKMKVEAVPVSSEKTDAYYAAGEEVRKLNLGKLWDQPILDEVMAALEEYRAKK